MTRAQRGLLADRTAITALEYGIIASVLSVTLIGIFTTFGQTIKALFATTTSAL